MSTDDDAIAVTVAAGEDAEAYTGSRDLSVPVSRADRSSGCNFYEKARVALRDAVRPRVTRRVVV